MESALCGPAFARGPGCASHTRPMTQVTTLRQQLRHSSAIRRAWSGAFCVVQGAMLTLRSPSLLRLALIPVLVNLVLYPVCMWGAWKALFPAHALLFPWAQPEGFWALPWLVLSTLLYAVLGVVFFLTALLFALVLAAAVAAPVLDAISAGTESAITGQAAPAGPGVVEGVLRAVKGQLLFLLLYLPALLVGGIAYVLPVIGLVVGPAVQAGITVTFLAVQYLEWPAERRRKGVMDRFRLVRANAAACLGFGAAAWAMMVFPFMLPLIAVGGTLLFLGLEEAK